MAYEIHIMAIPEKTLQLLVQFQKPIGINQIDPIKTAMTTHYFVSNGTELDGFDEIFTTAIESGQDIAGFWHPLRPPRYHLPLDVKIINRKLKETWGACSRLINDKELLDSYMTEFTPVLDVYEFADTQDLGIISFLDKPIDIERANKVIYPVS